MRKVKDIMTTEVISVTPETKVSDIADAMFNGKITGLPVLDGLKLVGMVSETDLVASEANIHIPTMIQILDGALYAGDTKKMKAELEKITAKTAQDLMTKDVITVSPETDVHELATMMLDTKANPIPVVDGEGAVVGIVSRADVIHLIAHES